MSNSIIADLERKKKKLEEAQTRALKKAALRLEREIKNYIKEYGRTHKTLRYVKDQNGITVKNNQGKAKKKLGPALTITGNYAAGWTSEVVQSILGDKLGIVKTHVVYAPHLEKHYKVAEICIERIKDEIREIIKKELDEVMK